MLKYTNIVRLNYKSYPGGKQMIPCKNVEGCCQCVKTCDESCLNHILKVECYDVGSKKDPICNISGNCEVICCNRRFENREYKNVMIFKEGIIGMGLKSQEFIKKGSFVIEYVGEVINDVEMRVYHVYLYIFLNIFF